MDTLPKRHRRYLAAPPPPSPDTPSSFSSSSLRVHPCIPFRLHCLARPSHSHCWAPSMRTASPQPRSCRRRTAGFSPRLSGPVPSLWPTSCILPCPRSAQPALPAWLSAPGRSYPFFRLQGENKGEKKTERVCVWTRAGRLSIYQLEQAKKKGRPRKWVENDRKCEKYGRARSEVQWQKLLQWDRYSFGLVALFKSCNVHKAAQLSNTLN